MALKGSEVQIVFILGLALLICGSHGLRPADNKVTVFDITKFGAKAGGKVDSNTAFTRAWIAACNTNGQAKVLIPAGTFMSGEVFWRGPCKGFVTVEVKGTVIANKDISEFPNGGWFMIENVNGFKIVGSNNKGSFNGNGRTSWKYDTCKTDSCGYPPLPPSFTLTRVKNGDIGYLTSIDSKGYHFKIKDSSDMNLHNLNIRAPPSTPHTNGVAVTNSNNIKVTDSVIQTGGGKDCVIWGPGSTNHVYNNVACH